jgi:hypothetical protein
VHLPDSSVDSKFLPIKLDPLLVARRALIDRCCSKMWDAVRAAGKRQLLLLHSISGVGKTCAAVAVIYQLQRLAKDAKCTMLIQLISGHSAAAVRGEFVKFGRALSRRLKLDESATDDEVILKLTAHLKDTRYAIFADDASEDGLKELMKLLPVSSEGCTVIATSRLMNEGHGQRVAAGAAAVLYPHSDRGQELEAIQRSSPIPVGPRLGTPGRNPQRLACSSSFSGGTPPDGLF